MADDQNSFRPKSSRPSFQEFFTRGGFAARAEVSREKAEEVIAGVNERFGLDLTLSDAVFELLGLRIPVVAGRYRVQTELPNRKLIRTSLQRLTSSAEGIGRAL